MNHYGDITKINGFDVPLVDIVTGGSPCQDLSVAGKRAGLDGERSGLFMEQIRIIKEMREHDRTNKGADVDIRFLKPRYMVWENVPGAFSSNKGEDFRCVLEETARIADKNVTIPRLEGGKWSKSGCIVGDGWSIAWRLHDAQFWGVPQRRKRICLLADFNGDTAAKILFELFRETNGRNDNKVVLDIRDESKSEIQPFCKGLSGNTKQSEQERETTSGIIGTSTYPTSYTLKIRGGVEVDSKGKKAGKGALIQTELSGTLGVSQDQTLITGSKCLNSWDVQSKHIQPEDGIAEALYSGECRGGGGESYVLQKSQGINGEIAGTLDSSYYKGCGERQGIEREVILYDAYQHHGYREGETCNTFTADQNSSVRGDTPLVYGISSFNSEGMKSDNPIVGIKKLDTARTLDLNGGSPAGNQGGVAIVCLEGNGSRESYKGNGYKESETMYTLNTIEQHAICIENHPNDSRVKISKDGNVQTLSSRMGTGGGNVPLVMEEQPLMLESTQNHETVQNSGISTTLTANMGMGGGYVPMVVEPEPVCVGNGQLAQARISDKVGALNCMHDQQAVMTYDTPHYVVRRLTPLECERLQGFPDGWTDIGEWIDSKGKKHKDADTPRYKALGNSIALPFWQWLAERIVAQYEGETTMASLFDGIGGFPLAFSRCGCTPKWASEIEEFPIAVTKIRFPENETE